MLFKDVDVTTDAADVHNGYFSVDKKGAWSDTAENNQSNRDNAERAYNLIMRDKEKLLSFDTKLKFIFSHSALREGWDNPNVFQICALREIGTERGRRQSIGRGLRICVNQNGERVRDVNVNILTVIANESYETFADRLQQEIEEETGYKFGIVEPQHFAAIVVTKTDGSTGVLGFEESKAIFEHLKTEGLVNAQGKVQDTLRRALKENTLALPDRFAPHLTQSGKFCESSQAASRSRTPTQRRRSEPGKPFSTVQSSRRFGIVSSTRPPTAWISTTRT